jgi:hypothetical protein
LINIPGGLNEKIFKEKLKYVLEKIQGYRTITTYSELLAENQNVNLDIRSNF